MNSQNPKIRWGVLGWARIARTEVVPAIQRSSNSLFHAIASTDASKQAECRSRFPGLNIYPAYDDLLRDPEVDAVYIPLPNSLHRKWTLKAATHGKHILCEKPLALNTAECREMIAAAAANKVLLMEAFMYRYTDRTRLTLEILQSGVLGDIKFISSNFRFLLANPASIKLKAELGGGALYDVGCYPVNFTGMVMDHIAGGHPGGSPESISVQCVRNGGVDILLSALLKYPSGIVAALHCGFNAQRRIHSEIIGSKGLLEIPDTFLDSVSPLILTEGDKRREIPVPQSDRYRSEIEDFADAIVQKRAPKFTLSETVRNMEVLDRLFTCVK